METVTLIALVAIIIFYLWYISLVVKRNAALKALSGIDVQLKKRSNLLPNILKIAKKFMESEIDLIADVTAMRSKVNKSYNQKDNDSVKQHLDNVASLDKSLGQLMVNVENYPELKSDQTMINAQKTFNEVEENIAAARRFYNASAASLNNAVEIFPGNIIAKVVNIKSMPFYEADANAKNPIDTDDYLQ